jgi:hypothetical protein
VEVVEVLIRPRDQSQLIALKGIGLEDCDGFVMYAACLLLILGIPCSLVIVNADRKRPDEFSHVYLAAYPEGFGKRRIPLDFSHGDYPGWECPNLGRREEMPVQVTLPEQLTKLGLALAVFGGVYWGLSQLEKVA